MNTFYKKTLSQIFILLLVTIGLIYIAIEASHRGEVLFPVRDGQTPWVVDKEPTLPKEDGTFLTLDNASQISYSFEVSKLDQYPYASYILDFLKASPNNEPVNFSQYNAVSFRILCQPKNVLLFAVFSLDEVSTHIDDTSTHRVSSTFFTCDSQWRDVTINFDEIETPDWWLEKFGHLLTSDRYFRRDKISEFRFVNSLQSPRGEHSEVMISDIRLRGENKYYLYVVLAIVTAFWLAFLIWVTRSYYQSVVKRSIEKVRQDMPIVAYQKLSVSPHKDKEKDTILRFMATQYSDPELSIETTISTTGLNRHKVNEVLKSELGLTFSSYLNKLRLTEAARLLVEEGEMNISEVAYAVGYNNVSYFTRLFKTEYGCSPKAFRGAKHI